MSHVRIVMTGHARGEVFIDGVKAEGVVAVTFSSRIEQANLLTLEMLAAQVEVEGPATVSCEPPFPPNETVPWWAVWR
jgi:hypothetical protein